MSTPFVTKFAALGVALLINGMMIGVVAYLFNGQLHQRPAATALAPTSSLKTASVNAWVPTL